MDFTMLTVVILLCIYSVLAVYSATSTSAANNGNPYFFIKKELVAMLIGIVCMALTAFIDYNRWKRYMIPLYIINIVILIVVLFIGSAHKGAQSWIEIGTFQLQPSEFSKLILIVTMASFFATRKGQLDSMRDLVMALLHLSIPIVLVLAQPDLGTAMCYVAILLGMMLVAGFPARHFAIILVAGLIVGFSVIQFRVLEDYQLNRLTVFINPDNDPQGAGYNLLQSKIAIVSGQLTGKGLFSGTQTRLQFLPERHTDFIFSVIGEEAGFLGTSLLLFLFFMLIMRGIRAASFSKNMFGSLIAAGIISLWLFQIVINVGMTIGLMPITGIPLPFISYGNSSLMVHLIAVGMLLNIYARSYV
ncbi:MAG: rod shape-determining protein RodA [Rubrobacteridae bacterium]|nr:rod shape-determining protein RodA [Rubrobacteridae bacterium]